MTRGFSRYIWPLELPNTTLDNRVFRARHALAIDEERTTFAPVLWDEDNAAPQTGPNDQKLLQVWFAGVHSNVGGGYPDNSLANVSLAWMMAEAEAKECGLKFKAGAVELIAQAHDKDGRLYNSRSGIGGYYRYGPRRISDFYALRPGEKENHRVAKIHESVLARIQVGAHLYAPIAVPHQYAVVSATGRQTKLLGHDTRENPDGAKDRARKQDSVWNVVWRRRAIYFLTVFASLYLVLYPLVRESYAFEEMATRLRIVSDAIRLIGGTLPSGASRWIAGYARDPAWFLLWATIVGFLIWYNSGLKSEINTRMRRIWDRHIPDGHALQPRTAPSKVWSALRWLFVAILFYFAAYPLFEWLPFLHWLKAPDPWWDNVIHLYSEQPVRFVICVFLIFYFLPEDWIQAIRKRPEYQWAWRGLKMTVAPAVFALLILYSAFAFGNHVLFNVRDSFGAFCKPSKNEKGWLNADNNGFECKKGTCKKTIEFDSAHPSLCMSTAVFAERAKRYAINVKREPADKQWTFWNEPAFMGGQPVSQMTWWKQPILWMLFPFRRSLDRPWANLIVRYGPTGTEESFLDPEPPDLIDDLADPKVRAPDRIPVKTETRGEAWTAKRDGEIFVYINKPVLGPWGIDSAGSVGALLAAARRRLK